MIYYIFVILLLKPFRYLMIFGQRGLFKDSLGNNFFNKEVHCVCASLAMFPLSYMVSDRNKCNLFLIQSVSDISAGFL